MSFRQLWIPECFAHGFVTLSETVSFLYKTTDFYAPECECCIAWNALLIGNDRNFLQAPLLSGRDYQDSALSGAEVFA